jgi:hypothetical protein
MRGHCSYRTWCLPRNYPYRDDEKQEILRDHYGSIKAIRDLKLTKGGRP